MPPSSQTVKEYCSLIARSRLKSPDEVKDAYRRWQETAKSSSDAEAEPFRKYLVSRRLLTEYQSHLLLRGHTDGYFLDQYTILDLIGKGRMAGVYKAIHASGQVVALKVLPPKKAKEPMILSRFQREGRLLTKLDHGNVVRAFQIGEANGKHFIVMEYLEGEPLDEVLDRRKRLPPAEAVRIIHQTLLGLQHVFEKGMVHRDLKPANLILVPAPVPGPGETTLNSVVKILDIGLGRATFDENSREPDPDSQLTTEGTLLGTPEYLAPEQARSAHDVDIRADIYSLGCVLYHLLTGQPPFPPIPGEGVLQQIVKHVTEMPRPLSDFLPQVPEGLQQVMNWMMAKDPNQRYPTPARAAQALQMFLMQTPDSSPTNAPLPAFVQYLQSTAPADTSRATTAPSIAPSPPPPAPGPTAEMPKIPTGRLEPDPRRKPTDRKKDGSATRPKAPMTAGPDVAPLTADDEYDVEIVTVAPSEFVPPPPSAPPPPMPKDPGEARSLLDLDRRDYIMASIGGGIVLIAILLGYGVSRLLRGPTPSPVTEQSTPTEQTIIPRKKIVEEKKPEVKIEEPKEPKTDPKEMMKDPKEMLKDPKVDSKDAKDSKDPKTEDPKKDDPKVDPKTDPKKDDPKVDLKTDPKKDDPKVDPKKVDPKTDPKKDDPKVDPKKVDPKADPKKDDPKVDPKKVDPKTDPKKDDPKVDPKKVDPKTDPKKDDPKVDPKKVDPKADPKKDELKGLAQE